MRKILVVILCVALLVGCSSKPTPTPASKAPAAPAATKVKTINIKLSAWDETEKKPADKLEIWAQGMGSWYPDLKHGGDVTTIKGITVGAEQDLFIYPDGRNGKEIQVSFMASEEITSESDRDAIRIEVTDTKVNIFGTPIEGLEVEINR